MKRSRLSCFILIAISTVLLNSISPKYSKEYIMSLELPPSTNEILLLETADYQLSDNKNIPNEMNSKKIREDPHALVSKNNLEKKSYTPITTKSRNRIYIDPMNTLKDENTLKLLEGLKEYQNLDGHPEYDPFSRNLNANDDVDFADKLLESITSVGDSPVNMSSFAGIEERSLIKRKELGKLFKALKTSSSRHYSKNLKLPRYHETPVKNAK